MLHADHVYAKTDKGRNEIDRRLQNIAPRVRSALIQIDGRTPLRLLLERNAVNPHFGADVAFLHAQGYIAARLPDGSVERPQPAPGRGSGAREQLIELAQHILGKHAQPIVARIAKCGDRSEELSACIDGCYKLIRLTIDEGKAEQFARQGRSLLGPGA